MFLPPRKICNSEGTQGKSLGTAMKSEACVHFPADNPRMEVTCVEAGQIPPQFQGIQRVKLVVCVAGSTKRNEPCFQTWIMSCLQIQPWEASGLLLEELLFPHIFIH